MVILMAVFLLAGCKTHVKQTELSQQEVQQINEIDKTLVYDEWMVQVKNQGYLSELIDVLKPDHAESREAEQKKYENQLNALGLTLGHTIEEIEKGAQKYLDKYHAGTKIGDERFGELKHYYINNKTEAQKMTADKPESGILYVYMGLYIDNAAQNSCDIRLPDADLYPLTLGKMFEEDFAQNYSSSEVLKTFLADKGITKQ